MTHSFEYKISQTTCPYCGVGCGVDATIVNGQLTSVSGSLNHPANQGKLCVKGSNLAQTVSLEGRLLTPTIAGQEASWDEATDLVAQQFKQIIAQHGPDSVAFYVSGQILTEDYYVANKLMKGYIGSANIDTNSRLCMASAVAGYKRAFGADTVPCNYQDIDHTELLILIGSNAAWTHPILYQRMERAKQANPNMKVVIIDPRRTATEQLSDLHLPIKPGSDVALFNGLLNYLVSSQHLNQAYIEQFTEGWTQTLSKVAQYTLTYTAAVTGINEASLLSFFTAFAQTNNVLSFYSQGVNQSSQGTDKCNAIINCHLATGKIGYQGAGPFSITGQPNAMGGREVGGLANTLASHMHIEDPAHRELVQTFWQSPKIPHQQGTKAVDMFDQIKTGKIKAVWIMATNPMVSLPNRAQIAAALTQCDFVVVSDCVVKNDTLAFADVALPATTWAEKDGTVTNSERCISRQKGLLPAPGLAKHDWQMMSEVAQKMGFDAAFDYSHPSEIFTEHAALSGYRNTHDTTAGPTIIRDFDISGLASLSRTQYDQLEPIQWPVNTLHPNGCKQMFSDNVFFTPSKKAQFISVEHIPPKYDTTPEYPLVLNSGRQRDQWHTMTRTGKSATLAKHTSEPFIAIHPQDAKHYQISEQALIQISSPFGAVIANAKITSDQRMGECFMPIHWNQNNASHANVGACYSSAVDPISGQPESKHTAVALQRIHTVQRATLFCRNEINVMSDFWTSSIVSSGLQYQLAWFESAVSPLAFCQSQFQGENIQWHSFTRSDEASTTIVAVADETIIAIAFFADSRPAIQPDWAIDLLGLTSASQTRLSELLAGKVDEKWLNGKTICSCFNVGENNIIDAINELSLNSVEALGKHLKCGTNCGSCKSELSELLNQHAPQSHKISRFKEHAIAVQFTE